MKLGNRRYNLCIQSQIKAFHENWPNSYSLGKHEHKLKTEPFYKSSEQITLKNGLKFEGNNLFKLSNSIIHY